MNTTTGSWDERIFAVIDRYPDDYAMRSIAFKALGVLVLIAEEQSIDPAGAARSLLHSALTRLESDR